MKRSGLDKDMIVTLGVISLLAAIALVFATLCLFDIEISTSNLAVVIGSFSAISASIWLVLLCRNC